MSRLNCLFDPTTQTINRIKYKANFHLLGSPAPSQVHPQRPCFTLYCHCGVTYSPQTICKKFWEKNGSFTGYGVSIVTPFCFFVFVFFIYRNLLKLK